MTAPLFTPIRIGAWDLPHRIVMAPLTRSRAGETRTPNPLMVEYYTQRASAAFILTEATAVDPSGVGYANTPGIWSAEQVEGWKHVTRAVHAAGGRILLQLWHVGRISDPMFLNGALPVAPSAIAASGHVSLVRPERPFVTPRALGIDELPGIVAMYRRGAENALAAGFDGVEIHGANGYLLDQFLQDGTNHRTDEYGGSIENRARLMLEVTDAVLSVWSPDRVGMHIAPRGDAHGISDSDPLATFGYLATELGRRKIAFLCARESLSGPITSTHLDEAEAAAYKKTHPAIADAPPVKKPRIGPRLKELFAGPYIANEGFTFDTGNEIIAAGQADAVAFGVPFLANPDLPARFAKGAALNTPNPATFYADGPLGYTDYPALGQ